MEQVELRNKIERAQQTMDEQQNLIRDLVEKVGEVDHRSGDILDEVKSIEQLSQQASRATAKGDQEVTTMTDRMKKIYETTMVLTTQMEALFTVFDQTQKILETVQALGGQTKILALNASIEAARSGEHGRGFSIIAKQLKELADQSSDSSKQVDLNIRRLATEITTIASTTKDNASSTEEGMMQIRSLVDSFSAIRSTITELTMHNRKVFDEADSLHQMSAYVRSLSEPIARNRIIISEGLEAAELTTQE